ncbi:MAG: hypothetical protein HY461_00895 [Parcubacteria group bacterium]|nr:hypothetical protein [Parcubacteria group bacterium]
MTVVLRMEPQTPPMTWVEFCERSDPYSIGLDGYVAEGPKFDPGGPRANFNHHEGVSRLETRATCAQVLMATRQGLFDSFRDESGPRVVACANDCDEDVCTTWFLLNHGSLATHAVHPLLNRLVAIEDALDATAGAYPFPKDLEVLQEMAWVYEPYRRFRLSGELDRKDPAAYVSVVTDVGNRIMAHITGHGSAIPLDVRYDRIGGGQGWAMINEIGAQGRTGAFSDGIRAYLSVRERPNGGFTYTLGRMSPFVHFNVPKILARLNEAEGSTSDRWGGGDTIGGSPRVGGSKLSPDEVARIIEEISG